MSDPKQDAMIEAIKKAILVEIKGHQLYSHAVTQTKESEAKNLFEMLASDEEKHIRILQTQFNKLMKDHPLDLVEMKQDEIDSGAKTVINENFAKSVNRSDFDMAIIGIGCDLEAKAISYYTEQATLATDPDIKKLFEWLADWETDHLNQLRKLEEMYQEAFWADQGFSPM